MTIYSCVTRFFLLQMYISLHSYGQKILYPWSHAGHKIEDWQDLDILGKSVFLRIRVISKYDIMCCDSKGQMMRETILDASGGRYSFTVGTSPEVNYFSNGGSDDWVRG